MAERQGRARARTSIVSVTPAGEGLRRGRAARMAAAVLAVALALAASAWADPPATDPQPGTAAPSATPAATAASADAPASAAVPASIPPPAQAPVQTPAHAEAGAPTPPDNLSDLAAWLDYQQRSHLAELPLEARLFHRRGVLLHEAGKAAEATRMVRGAADLDPSYLGPQLTLAAWSLTSEPSQALLRYATVLNLARENFLLQLSLAANAVCSSVQAIFLGLLVTALLIVFARRELLTHAWQEALARFIGRRTAMWWSWALFMLPFAVGFGFVLPTLLLLGWLWPHLRFRERFVFVAFTIAVVGLPLLGGLLDRLTLPLDETRAPLYGAALVESQPLTDERWASLARKARAHPDDPYLQFAAGWASRRTGHLASAERFYRAALQQWPTDDRTLNNLGCTLLMEGRSDEALERFTEATRANPSNAAAWFNQAQVHTQRFDYREASDAMTRASALDFEMVKSTQDQSTDDGNLPLVESWIAPRRMWQALATAPFTAVNPGALPPAWRQRLEMRGWPISLAALLLAVLGAFAGIRYQRDLPLRVCGNCGRVVCRRCSQRRREVALCNGCVDAEQRAESPDFVRMLLLQRQRKRERIVHFVRTAIAALIPGYGLLALQRVFTPLLLLIGAMGALAPWFGQIPPFAFEPRLALGAAEPPWQLQAASWVLIYAVSLVAYFRALSRREKPAAPAAPRPRSKSAAERPSLSDAA